ncbi:hypothetical protein QR680_003579 [Steinernema hermaphroditum]|uniref:F-box associated domain-containing protein n=1 Tax=Steinernema hermaphroditum TaxID=289476 RepID=A0AA39HKV9_9BILA|nr:hypothetical protein QR680_003579 [Steinernema hermaphroditum]
MDTVSLWFIWDVTALLSKADLVTIFELDNLAWQSMAGEHIPQSDVVRFKLDVSVTKRKNAIAFTYSSSAATKKIQKKMFRVCTNLFIGSGIQLHGKEKAANTIKKIIAVDYAENMEMHDVANFDSYFPNFWPRFVSCLIVRKCRFNSNTTFSHWMSRILRARCLEQLEICDISLEKESGEDFEDEILDSLLDGDSLIDVKISGNENFMNLSPEFLDRLVLGWSECEEGFEKPVDVSMALDRYEFRAVRKKYFKHRKRLRHPSTSHILYYEEALGYSDVTFRFRSGN